MMSPEEAYKYDSTFRHVVDIMCAELQVYRITPAELRQAVMLAATLHESRNIRPLLLSLEGLGLDQRVKEKGDK
jgi:hypothetical protein